MYVLRLEPADARVVVGPKTELGCATLEATDVNWISGPEPDAPVRATARIRHHHTDAPATVTSTAAGRARVVFDEPQFAVAPGQAVVFYDGDEVLGGGWISG
jgi:tRNA-specific 2-thiouridylase